MAEKRSLKQRVASVFELPGDVMLDVARITMIGQKEMLIENHRGIDEFNPGRVVLRVPHGQLAIDGDQLEIGSISPDQMVILGRIRAVSYIDV